VSTNPEFAAHCVELLSPLGPTRSRRMFGGHGFYVDGIFLALTFGERLYLKTDAQTRPRFEAAGCEPFVYDGAGKQVTVSYWTAPDDAMESPMLMRPWACLAMEAALRARNAKSAKPARKRKPAVQARGGTRS
jgi:DNA transformation protein and related proteins